MKMMTRLMTLCGVMIATGVVQTASAQELITNGGFETGTFSGWSLSGSGSSGVYYNGSNDPTLHNYRSAFIGAPVTLYQNIATTVGQSYTFGFTNEVDPGSAIDSFSAAFGGQSVFSESTSSQPFIARSFSVTALSTSTQVSFTFSGGNFENFDNVTVTALAAAAPEPSTWGMMIVGLGVIGFALRRRRKVTARVSYAI